MPGSFDRVGNEKRKRKARREVGPRVAPILSGPGVHQFHPPELKILKFQGYSLEERSQIMAAYSYKGKGGETLKNFANFY